MTGGAGPVDADVRAWVESFLARGEEGAFRAIYRAHTEYLFRLAVRLCGGRREVAEDALQEAWLRAAQTLPRFRWDSRLRTWLAGIVVNCCRELRRRSERETPTAEPAPRASEPAGLDLESALLALPDGLREVLVLHAIEGYTHEEIAARPAWRPGAPRGARGTRGRHPARARSSGAAPARTASVAAGGGSGVLRRRVDGRRPGRSPRHRRRRTPLPAPSLPATGTAGLGRRGPTGRRVPFVGDRASSRGPTRARGEARKGGQVLGTTAAPAGKMDPSGFFLIRADNMEQALALARGCPHLRHGGSIVVRTVDRT